jgi:CopG family nickel-responsive transcriptional regulator
MSVTSCEIVLLLDVIRVMTLVRFGVSAPEDLLEAFDEIVKKRGYVGRSEALRDAMRAFISDAEWESSEQDNTASLNIVYRHKPRLMSDLIRIQHNAGVSVISTVHIHITRTHCLEVITMKGTKKKIEETANRIAGLSGVDYARLFAFSLPEDDGTAHHH